MPEPLQVVGISLMLSWLLAGNGHPPRGSCRPQDNEIRSLRRSLRHAIYKAYRISSGSASPGGRPSSPRCSPCWSSPWLPSAWWTNPSSPTPRAPCSPWISGGPGEPAWKPPSPTAGECRPSFPVSPKRNPWLSTRGKEPCASSSPTPPGPRVELRPSHRGGKGL